MQTNKFLEFWSSDKYTWQKTHRPVGRVRPFLLDEVSYRSTVFSIAYEYLLSSRAAHAVAFRVFKKVLSADNNFVSHFEDDDVWSGNEHFPGLNQLTIDTCVEVLAAGKETKKLFSPEPHAITPPETPATPATPRPKTWWNRAAPKLREKSLPHFQVAALSLAFRKSPADIALLLTLPPEKVDSLLRAAHKILAEEVEQWAEAETEKISNDRGEIMRLRV